MFDGMKCVIWCNPSTSVLHIKPSFSEKESLKKMLHDAFRIEAVRWALISHVTWGMPLIYELLPLLD